MGRPTKFTAELAQGICEKLASGMTLREVCRDEEMPSEAAVRGWAIEDREGFSAQYARAREIGYQSMADELLEIADDGSNDWIERKNQNDETYVELNHEHVQRSRLRVDTRKWMLSKALPKVFGDKLIHSGDEENPIHHQHDGLHEFRGRIAGIASRTGEGRANGHANGRSGNGSAA